MGFVTANGVTLSVPSSGMTGAMEVDPVASATTHESEDIASRTTLSKRLTSSLAGSENATVCYILDSIDAFLDGREPELSSRKALMATELIFATYESARRRARVHLPLEIDDSPLLSMLESGEVAVPDEPARDGSA